jgi:tetratricopeptide (TPR) repeat protein
MSQELHGVAVYNPDLLAKHELVSLFVARRPLLDRLVRDLHDETSGVAQHHLIVGRRGMGKTTLLRRLRYAIEDDPSLDARFVALVFPEEQYNVASLSDFWLNCVDALADALESRGRREAAAIDEQIAEIAAIVNETERRASALSLLLGIADRIARRLVLLVDNLDLVFARFAQDDWTLREILSREPRLLLIGATSQALESSFRYDQAFYDFFRIHQLDGLDEKQTFEVMRHMAEITKQSGVLEVIEHDPGRIQTLRLLSGGNPRTLVLLFNLLSQGTEGDARSDLERLLDQITPLYKHRFEELPAQAQRVVDGLALGWDPMTARDLADRLRLDINQTSAQLNRLVKQGTVEKTRLPGTARTGFQISERFFNIWYLMRASRRMRRRLIFLVKFLELFFPKPALQAQAQRRLRAMESSRDADYGFALAQVTDDAGLRHALETHSLRAALADYDSELGAILDLDGEDRALATRAERVKALLEAERAVMAKRDWPDGLDGGQFWELLGGTLELNAREKLRFGASLSWYSASDLTTFYVSFERERQRWVERTSDAVAAALCTALREGYIDNDLREDDIESAVALGESLEVRPLLLAVKSERGMPVERALFDSCIHETRSLWVRAQWAKWASHVSEEARLDTIRGADPRTACTDSLLDFVDLLANEFRRFEESAIALREAIERDPDSVHLWNALGTILQFRLSRYDEAEAAYRRAIEIDPSFPGLWNALANLLHHHLSRYDEADAAYQRAATLAPYDPGILNSRAWLLYTGNRDLGTAERAAQWAVEAKPNDPYFMHTLACIQAARAQWPAELARRFLTDEKSSRDFWDETMRFFSEVVHHGHTADARALVQSLPNAEVWAPLILALEALERGSTEPLRALSPEMRAAVELALSRIAPEFSSTPSN